MIIIKVFCFLCHGISAYSGFFGSARLFFEHSQEDKREKEKEWMPKQCQKLRSKVKESFIKLVNCKLFLSKSAQKSTQRSTKRLREDTEHLTPEITISNSSSSTIIQEEDNINSTKVTPPQN